MIPYYVEVTQDVSDPADPRPHYIVRAPLHNAGYGHTDLEKAYLGCMAMACGFTRYDVEQLMDDPYYRVRMHR